MSINISDAKIQADEFQKVFDLGMNDYNRKLIGFLKDCGMIYPGCRALDIGCGVGKHGTYFAALGCDVTLSDISPEMLANAEKNMAGAPSPWRTVLLDFSTVPLDELPFSSPFDFSISSMCPAIKKRADIEKMSAITSGWCFVSSFVSWSQPERDRFYAAMGMDIVPEMNRRTDMYSLLEDVKAAGYSPEMRIVPYDWCDRRTKEDAVKTILWRRNADLLRDEAMIKKANEAFSALCDEDGLFTDSVKTKVMWLYWNTKKQTSR